MASGSPRQAMSAVCTVTIRRAYESWRYRRSSSASPVASPIRTGNSSARCAATAASTADLGEPNTAHTPSPVCLNNQPPCASVVLHNTSSWAASATRIPSASASHRRVEPSTSVNKNVTSPEGAAAAGADTPAESHNRRAPTCHIGGIQPRPPPRGAAWMRGRVRSWPQIESIPAVLRNALQDHSQKISRASDSGLLASIAESDSPQPFVGLSVFSVHSIKGDLDGGRPRCARGRCSATVRDPADRRAPG